MKIIGCVPLPGQGVVARYGDLVAVTEATGPGTDPLLDAVEAIASDAGDGAALVLAAARAVLANPSQPSGACAGVTSGGEVAVLVHGDAVVAVTVDGGEEVELTASGSLLPVNRTFTGTTVSLRMAVSGRADLDSRLRLDGGVVYGGGLVVTASAELSASPVITPPGAQGQYVPVQEDELASGLATESFVIEEPAHSDSAVMGAGPAESDVSPAGETEQAPLSDGNPAGDIGPAPLTAREAVEPPPPSWPAEPLVPQWPSDEAADTPPPPVPPAPAPGPGGTMLSGHFASEFPDAGQDEVPAQDEMWIGADDEADGWRAPEFIVPSGQPAPGREPKLHQPDPDSDFESFLLIPEPGAPEEHDHPHPHQEAAPLPPMPQEEADLYIPEPVLVDGVFCSRNHFNDPNVQYCRQCGISMVQITRQTRKGQRPPLGVLLLDDGTGFTLDRDYVVGREPVLDGDVAAGRARPLRITDPDGTVSRLHLRISLVGWQVEIRDLGSANGSVLYLPAGEQRLTPYDSVVIEPGARIGIGHRSLQYLSYRAG